MKMEPTEGSETSAIINQTPGNYPKENLLYSAHGESLKSRTYNTYCFSTARIVVGTRRTVSLYVLLQSSYIYYYCAMSVLFLVESSPCSLLSGILSQIIPSCICHCSCGHQNLTLKQGREDNHLAKNSHIIIKRVYVTYLINLKNLNSLSLFFFVSH